MNSYEAKLEARRARFEELASKTESQSSMTYKRARSMASDIPFGQPVLVGHHSEGRDRRYRGKIHNTFAKSFALLDKAKYYVSRAESVGKAGISSDDPEALHKLRLKLAELEEAQARMKSINASIRKDDKAGLAKKHGLSDAQIAALVTADQCGRIGYPDYSLTNNNGNMRRIRERIKVLEATASRADLEKIGTGYTYREDANENRVMFHFDGKPSAEIRAILKSHAFKWSPSREAWVRHLSNSGIYAGKTVCDALEAV